MSVKIYRQHLCETYIKSFKLVLDLVADLGAGGVLSTWDIDSGVTCAFALLGFGERGSFLTETKAGMVMTARLKPQFRIIIQRK